MKAHLIRRGKHYAAKFYNPETRKWSHQSLKTTKKALADLRFGQFLEDRHKKELLGELNVEPVPLRVLVKEFFEYMEANRSEKYTKLARQFSEKWLPFFGTETLTTAITARMIQRYAIARKKDKCKIKGTPIANATVNRLTEKYYAHLAPSSLSSAVQRLNKKGNLLPKLLPKTDFAPFSGTTNREGEVPLTDSFERCYVPEVALLAGVAKLAYAADSKVGWLRVPVQRWPAACLEFVFIPIQVLTVPELELK